MSESNDRDRHPPGQYITREFPVAHAGSIPYFSPETWDIGVSGLVGAPFTLSHEEFAAQPRVERVSDLHCVGTWSVYDLRWEGVPLRHLIYRAEPLPEATHILVHADGGYSTNLPIEDLNRDDVIVADRLNGEPLTREHGYPARLVVPGKYAFKSAKWVRAFEFLSEDRPGFWESRGYSNSADPWTEDRFGE